MLSEERISDLAREMVKGNKSVDWLARTIEREAHREGQERMRERAAISSWMHYAAVCKKLNINPHDTYYGEFISAEAIRNLEIEEPK